MKVDARAPRWKMGGGGGGKWRLAARTNAVNDDVVIKRNDCKRISQIMFETHEHRKFAYKNFVTIWWMSEHWCAYAKHINRRVQMIHFVLYTHWTTIEWMATAFVQPWPSAVAKSFAAFSGDVNGWMFIYQVRCNRPNSVRSNDLNSRCAKY